MKHNPSAASTLAKFAVLDNHCPILIIIGPLLGVESQENVAGVDKTALNGAAQNISRKCANAPHPGKLPVEAIRKVFPPAAAAEGEFVQNFPRRKTFDINF